MQSRRDTLPEGQLLDEADANESRVDPVESNPISPSEPRERVTISSIPKGGTEPAVSSTISSLPKSTEALTGRRSRAGISDDLPARAVERLLVLWTELPIAAGDRAVARAVVDAVASLLPDALAGACLVPANGGPQEVVRASEVTEERAPGADPTRLFPSATYERVVTVEQGGTTIHLAGEDASVEDDGSGSSALVARAAAVLRRGLELSRIQARATDALAEARDLNAHSVQAEKLASLGQIAAGVVHELNNPLTSIVAYTDYLIRKAGTRPTGPDADEIDRLRRISESAGRMLRFTRDLVSYARPSSETPGVVGLHLVIDQAVAFCEHVVAGANVTVERRFADDLSTVLGKPEQLTQIFVNLITNACHAMTPSGGTLVIATREEGGLVCVDLADTGHGIQAEHVPHVFTPFFTTKTSGSGTGLGLAIVKSILDGHGGAIRVTSEPGQGATFTITLPVSPR
jgi:two-component system NtrC family sensor kinase